MPLRSTIGVQNDRPSSAIYIGNGPLNSSSSSSATTSAHGRPPSISSIPPTLPDLPEPPSPVLSNSSGLPSPPATNSTGSGSAGDPISATSTGPRRPLIYNSPSTRKNQTSHISRHSIRSVGELDAEGDGDPLEEDHTARLRSAALGRHAKTSAAASSENVVALQRVKSLAERNKLALDKLTLMARLTSPAPSSRHSRTNTNSVVSSPVSSPSSPSSSVRSRNRTSLPPPVSTPQEQPLSGSETERESFYTHYSNSSSPSLGHMFTSAHTSTATYQTPPQQQPTRPNHHRIASLASASVSTPYLPSTSRVFQTPPPYAQPLTKTRSTGGTNTTPSGSSGGSTSRTRLTPGSTGAKEDKLPAGSPKRRRIGGSGGSALTASSVASSNSEVSGEDPRAQIRRSNAIKEGETDVVQAALAAVASSRSRTSLDTKRRHVLPREYRRDEVVIEDDYPVDPVTPYRNGSTASQLRSIDRERAERGKGGERRQTARGGSAESALAVHDPPRRSVVGEVFKAVGLSPKSGRRLAREKEREKREFLGDDVFEERERPDEVGERRAERRTTMREHERDLMGLIGQRSATSLSHRRYSSRSRSRVANGSDDEDSDGGENDVMRTAPAGLRSYRQTYSTPQEPERDSVHLSLMKKERERERERGRDIITGRSMTSLSKYSAISTPVHVHQTGSSSSAISNNLPQPDIHSAASYSSRRSSAQIALNHTGSTVGGDSERAASRLSALVPIERTEHARLMADSLTMFEGHMTRMLSGEGSALNSVYISELVKAAQGVVSSADRLNGLLRSASKNAVEMEIDAEVADDIEVESAGSGMYSAKDMVHVWKRVNADYKDGIKASDELVRGITSFLLGIGKVLKDIGSDGASVVSSSSVASTSMHSRCTSINDEDIIRSTRGSSPSLSGGSITGIRRSVDVGRRAWNTPPPVAAAENPREEALRRLTMGRPPSSARPRERDQDVHYESPLAAHPLHHELITPASSKSSTSLGGRRLLMPREQREQEREERLSRMSSYEDLVASTSQDTIVPYDPSPSPAPRIRDSLHKPLPPLTIPKALPSLPSASSRQQNRTPEQDYSDPSEASSRGHERRKASNASLSTIRGVSIHPTYPTYPAALNPSSAGATTAVTTHTVSNSSPEVTPSVSSSSVLSSAESRRNIRSSVTFSKPSTESVPTLAGLQQQYEERQRTTTSEARVTAPLPPSTPLSGSETERPPKRQTWGARTGRAARGMSISGEGSIDDFGRVSLGRAADRSAASSLLGRKERRVVTGLFPS